MITANEAKELMQAEKDRKAEELSARIAADMAEWKRGCDEKRPGFMTLVNTRIDESARKGETSCEFTRDEYDDVMKSLFCEVSNMLRFPPHNFEIEEYSRQALNNYNDDLKVMKVTWG